KESPHRLARVPRELQVELRVDRTGRGPELCVGQGGRARIIGGAVARRGGAVAAPALTLPCHTSRGTGDGACIRATYSSRLGCAHHYNGSYLHQVAPSLRDASFGGSGDLAGAGFASQLPEELGDLHEAGGG